ncbi:MAG TPA: hypothetical protein VF613_09210 [Longimicrobium sp.]|jgi:hypothetical protein
MERNDANQGNEDNSAAVEHVENAQENRDALAEQARRTAATAGDSADRPIQQTNADGPGAGLDGGLNTTVDPGRGAGRDAAQGK